MNTITYLIQKLWNVVTGIHPLFYLVLIAFSGLLFFMIKGMIQKFRPNTKHYIAVAIALTIFAALPISGLVLLFLVELLLQNQPF